MIERYPANPEENVVQYAPLLPIREYGLEIQRSCQFGCDNCYMYQGENAGLRTAYQPLPLPVVAEFADRVNIHAAEYADNPNPRRRIDDAYVVLHGGEPLLNVRHLLNTVRILRDRITGPRLHIRVQTNAALLTEEVIKQLDDPAIDVMIGVSIDGLPEDHNRARPLLGGGPSYDTVAKNVSILRDRYPHRFLKLLCTLGEYNMEPPGQEDVIRYGCTTKAIPTYLSLSQFRPDPAEYPDFQLNFILPHASWDTPPPGWDQWGHKKPYAEWMNELFDYLWSTKSFKTTRIPFFDAIFQGIATEKGLRKSKLSEGEIFGYQDTSYVFIEGENGAIRATDALKAVSADADEIKSVGTATVFNTDFSELLHDQRIALRQMGLAALSKTCQGCDVVNICGGGRFSDRQHKGRFNNASVYCYELQAIINHMKDAVDTIWTKPS